MPKIVKKDCIYCPPPQRPESPIPGGPQDWQMHPSWIGGIEALNAYGDWVSRFVLPVAFQWIEEHKREVYASVPDHLRDDVGVVIAAAFRLVKELPAYKRGVEEGASIEAEAAREPHDRSRTNPVWTGVVKKVRASTQEAFAEQAELLGDEQV
jgi:hypothetical protein